MQRTAGTSHDPAIDEPKEAGEPQIRDQDHHPEQERDGGEIDRPHRLVERDGADCQHQRGANERAAGAVDVKAGQPPDRDDEIGRGEDRDRRDAHRIRLGTLPIPGRREDCSERQAERAVAPGALLPAKSAAPRDYPSMKDQRLPRNKNSRPALTIGWPS